MFLHYYLFVLHIIDILDFALADLAAAADAGVIGSCYKLCNAIIGSGTYAWEGCNVICDAIGINVFIDIIKKADLDPIYACQLANICPVRDCTAKRCASFLNSGFIPEKIQHGFPTTFYSGLQVYNASGPGEVVFTLNGAFSTENMMQRFYQPNGYTPGTYSIKFTVTTKDDDAKALEWLPGLYYAVVDVCEGVCGDLKPHTRTLAQAKANFTLTPPPWPGKN